MRQLLPILLLLTIGCARGQTRPARDFVTVDAPVVALTNVRLIDGTGQPGRADQAIIIRDGKIANVGAIPSVQIPTDALVIDLPGRTIVPGFVMVHEHLFSTPDGRGYTSTPRSFTPLYLAGGATTIRTGGSLAWTADRKAKAAVDRGDMAGPEIDLTSPYLEGPRLRWVRNRPRGQVLCAASCSNTSFCACQSRKSGAVRVGGQPRPTAGGQIRRRGRDIIQSA